jgi:hypothetical protein
LPVRKFSIDEEGVAAAERPQERDGVVVVEQVDTSPQRVGAGAVREVVGTCTMEFSRRVGLLENVPNVATPAIVTCGTDLVAGVGLQVPARHLHAGFVHHVR